VAGCREGGELWGSGTGSSRLSGGHLASQAGPDRSELFQSKIKRKQWVVATRRGEMSDVGLMSKEHSVVNIFRGEKIT